MSGVIQSIPDLNRAQSVHEAALKSTSHEAPASVVLAVREAINEYFATCGGIVFPDKLHRAIADAAFAGWLVERSTLIRKIDKAGRLFEEMLAKASRKPVPLYNPEEVQEAKAAWNEVLKEAGVVLPPPSLKGVEDIAKPWEEGHDPDLCGFAGPGLCPSCGLSVPGV